MLLAKELPNYQTYMTYITYMIGKTLIDLYGDANTDLEYYKSTDNVT